MRCNVGVQVIIQMVFIKDTQRRQVRLPEHERTKPGRQIITFLLICNLAMWIVYTFETQKVEANPVQVSYYLLLICIIYYLKRSLYLQTSFQNQL